jgi:serine/threonine-protein kinase
VSVATQRLRDAGFEVRAVRRKSVRPPNRVYAQDPAGGQHAETGSTVEIRVSDGPGINAVPEVEGMPRSQALDALRKLAFDVKERRRTSTSIGQNRAIGTDPPAGTQVEGGQTITLIVSTGPPTVSVPSVGGMSRQKATSTLQDAGFEVQVAERETDEADPGIVVAQDPYGGRARQGSTVTIVVAKRKPTVAAPSVMGMTVDEARARLKDAGLKVKVSDVPVPDPQLDGRVLVQDPEPGTEVRTGSRVVIGVGHLDGAAPGQQQPPDQQTPPGQGAGDQGRGPQGQGPPGQDGTG